MKLSTKIKTNTHRLLLLTACSGLVLTQSGCSYFFADDGLFPDRSNDYLKAQETKPIKVPSDLNANDIDDLYVIPPITESDDLGEVFQTPRPAALAANGSDNAVRIQTLNGESWAVVDLQPGQLWPRLREFLMTNGINPEYANGVTGVIETPWLLRTEDAATREKFRFTVVQGVQRSSSEVRVLEWQADADSALGRQDWPKVSSNKEREDWMLRKFADYVANSGVTDSVSLLAQGIDTKGRIKLYRGDDPHIVVDLAFYRAWASTQKALVKSDFEIIDRNRQTGELFVKYKPDIKSAEQSNNFFGGLFDGDDDVKGPVVYRVTVIDSSEREGWIEIRIKVHSVQKQDNLSKEKLENLLIEIKGQLS